MSSLLKLSELIPSFQSKGINLSLSRIESTIHRMGNPCKAIPAIQVIGTNGKGSIASFLESCLTNAGIKVGCTISPHLINWCERIRINGEMICQKDFEECINNVKDYSPEEQLTPFELVIASAFNYFSINQVDLMVLEVGLGGRLDATTAHPYRPLIAIAGIGLDHCEYLGKDLKNIAAEKAAVITPGSIVISSKQHPDVQEVLLKATKKQNSKLIWVPPLSNDWELGIPGEIQKENASVAKGILEELPSIGFKVSTQDIQEGLASAKWPGRLQNTSWKNLPLILDGAHNPHAIRQLSKERSIWKEQSQGVHWIIGIQANKDAPEMLRCLLKKNDLAWLVPIPNLQSWELEDLTKACPEISSQLHKADYVEQVLETLRLKDKWPIPCPVLTGSLYLVGDMLQRLRAKTQ